MKKSTKIATAGGTLACLLTIGLGATWGWFIWQEKHEGRGIAKQMEQMKHAIGDPGTHTAGAQTMPDTLAGTRSAIATRHITAHETAPPSMEMSARSGTANMRKEQPQWPGRETSADRFAGAKANPVRVTSEHPVSTFSVDVDTASYAWARGQINNGVAPAPESVRIEEFINYFPYNYEGPPDDGPPFAVHVLVAPAPWLEGAQLMHIALQGRRLDAHGTPPANLVFLIDVSGSMNGAGRLPLLKAALKLSLDALNPTDTVGIVTYAGRAGVALEPTPVDERATIEAALDALGAGGSTAGADGIRTAYALARKHKVDNGTNRVVLATDGDFNVGVSEPGGLERLIASERRDGIGLSVLGFGAGNYNDAGAQALAQHGNGNAAYIDSLAEAHKALVEQAAATLVTIAADVKIQIEFNPATVSEYRLMGYETRALAREDFADDRVDAGEIGAGHTVTAIYEIIPAGSDAGRTTPLRYSTSDDATTDTGHATELAQIRLRYKLPGETESQLITRTVKSTDALERFEGAPDDVRTATAAALLGERLRGARYAGSASYADIAAMAKGARGADPNGHRAGLAALATLAGAIAPTP